MSLSKDCGYPPSAGWASREKINPSEELEMMLAELAWEQQGLPPYPT